MSEHVQRTVRLDDGRQLTATVKVADYVAFERHFNVEAPLVSSRIEYWTFLTWASLKRQGDVTVEFDEFVGQVDEFLVTEDDVQPVPKGRSKKASPVS